MITHYFLDTFVTYGHGGISIVTSQRTGNLSIMMSHISLFCYDVTRSVTKTNIALFLLIILHQWRCSDEM